MDELKRKVALVTGASRGVGRGVAQALGEAGAIVYVTGRSVRGGPTTDGLPGTIQGTAEMVSGAGGEGIAVRCDHTVDEQVEALFTRIRVEQGKLDVVVNNAWGGYERYSGETFDAPFWEQPLWRWKGMFDAGLRAAYTVSRLAAPMLIERRRGLIVNISFGDRGKYLGTVVYDVSKHAVDRLAVGMAFELRDYGVTALSLYPGYVRTERVLEHYDVKMDATQSPLYTGRAVVALAADPWVIYKSGMAFSVSELAEEYGFTDIDGRRPRPCRLEQMGS
jgi:NAD(P)-dependent dehydrogenase (short-subunit alcohol dehydrogenase family)